MVGWGFLTCHARVLLCIARDPGVRMRDIASSLGITERSAHGLVADLAAAGYVVKQKDGRRNRYQIQAHMPLLEPARNLRSAKSSRPSPAREPSVTGQPGPVTVTSAASASQNRELPESAGHLDAAVGQTRKASGVGRPGAGLPGSAHPPSWCRTSCSRRCGRWPDSSAYGLTTTAGTAGPNWLAWIPEER